MLISLHFHFHLPQCSFYVSDLVVEVIHEKRPHILPRDTPAGISGQLQVDLVNGLQVLWPRMHAHVPAHVLHELLHMLPREHLATLSDHRVDQRLAHLVELTHRPLVLWSVKLK